MKNLKYFCGNTYYHAVSNQIKDIFKFWEISEEEYNEGRREISAQDAENLKNNYPSQKRAENMVSYERHVKWVESV